jgi:hypothetical protein
LCDQEGCVERELNDGLTGCLGCVNPLAYSTSFAGEGGSGTYPENTPDNFEPRTTKILVNDPRYKSGGPNKVTGRQIFQTYWQRYKINPHVNYQASSQFYSAGPHNGNSRIKKMQSWIDDDGATQLIGGNPASSKSEGTASTSNVALDLSAQNKTYGGSFKLSRTWNTPDGHRGGVLGGDGKHLILWNHANKKGTAQFRELSGVSKWQTPKGQSARWYLGGELTYT